jgi:hypothetical protein
MVLGAFLDAGLPLDDLKRALGSPGPMSMLAAC